MMTRLLWSVLVVVPVMLLLLLLAVVPVTAAAAVTATAEQDDQACLKLQFWTGGDDCAGDPDNTSINTVPTTPSDDCGTCCPHHERRMFYCLDGPHYRIIASVVSHLHIVFFVFPHQWHLTIPRLANAV
jgi:hypothetical protein